MKLNPIRARENAAPTTKASPVKSKVIPSQTGQDVNTHRLPGNEALGSDGATRSCAGGSDFSEISSTTLTGIKALLKFMPAPPVLPAGCEVAGLNGDMSKKGSEYTVRLRVPDGWKIPPHFHPAEEHVTVIQGAFWMGMGDKFDEAALKEMPVGGFHAIPKRVHHYGMAKGQTIIQLHGVGPWGITYVNSSDDPSKKAAEK